MIGVSTVGLYVLMLLPGAAASTEPPMGMSLWAVHASQEQRPEPHYDPELQPIKNALADLPYNTFHAVKITREKLPFNEDTRIDIDPKYTLVAMPLNREGAGKVKVDLRIEVTPSDPGKTPVKALQTRLTMQSRQPVKLRGLKREPGELVLVLAAD